MCGRFTLRTPASVLAEQFAVFEMPPLAARYNIAPSQPVPVVRLQPGGTEPRRQFVFLRWGLIPSWAKDPAIGNRMINARAETVAEKPSYRAALKRRRCLIAADGFYEWQRIGGRRRPHFIQMHDRGPFAFAGLWESWEGADHSAVESCTLLTTEPNQLVRPIHDRMPVILAPDDYRLWLDPAVQEFRSIRPLLRPYPAEQMRAHGVGTLVNSPANDEPQCIEPVD